MRVWKLSPETTVQEAFTYVKNIIENLISYYDIKIPFEGKFLEQNLSLKIEDLYLLDTSILVVETREEYNGFILTQEGVSGIEKCNTIVILIMIYIYIDVINVCFYFKFLSVSFTFLKFTKAKDVRNLKF